MLTIKEYFSTRLFLPGEIENLNSNGETVIMDVAGFIQDMRIQANEAYDVNNENEAKDNIITHMIITEYENRTLDNRVNTERLNIIAKSLMNNVVKRHNITSSESIRDSKYNLNSNSTLIEIRDMLIGNTNDTDLANKMGLLVETFNDTKFTLVEDKLDNRNENTKFDFDGHSKDKYFELSNLNNYSLLN